MTHVTCWLTAKNRISSGTLRSVIEYGLPFNIFYNWNQHQQLPSASIYSIPKISQLHRQSFLEIFFFFWEGINPAKDTWKCGD